jgi:hypothetical protein
VPALVALCLAAGGLGCGAGGQDEGGDRTAGSDPGPRAPSKRDYIVQADTICANAEQAIETEAEIALGVGAADFTVTPSGEIVFKPGRRPSRATIERFGARVVIPKLRRQLADLRALTPPSGDEAEVAEIYDTAEQGIDRLAGDPRAFDDRGATRRALNEARALGRSYGFFECGNYTGP